MIPTITEPSTPVILRNAASPNVSDELIQSVVDGIGLHDGMHAFVRSNETTFVRANDNLDWTISRDITGFTVDPTADTRRLLEGVGAEMRKAESGEMTLDIARRLGGNIGLFESPRSNIKLTTSDDFGRLLVYTDPSRSSFRNRNAGPHSTAVDCWSDGPARDAGCSCRERDEDLT